MPSFYQPNRHQHAATAMGLFVSVMCCVSSVRADPSVSNAVKSGTETSIESAQGESWFGAPTIEERTRAGLIFLRSEGYYGARIDVLAEDAADLRASNGNFTVKVPDDTRRLRVVPGDQFTIRSVDLSLQGPESEVLQGARADALVLTTDLNNAPARAGDVLRVQGQALAAIKEAGFTQAEDQYPDIVVDHANGVMSVTYRVTAGPLTQFGDIVITGVEKTPKSWVANAANVTAGDIATGANIRRISERFRAISAYQSVDLSLTPDPSADIGPNGDATNVANITLNLQERDKRTWSAGAQWSTSDGLGIDAATSFFHRFHRADTLTFSSRIGTLDSSIGADLRLPSFRGPSRDLFLESRAGQETSDAFTRSFASLGATYILPRGRKDFLTYGLGLDVARTRTPTDLGFDARQVNGADLSLLVRYLRDRADDILNPTQGWRAQGEVRPSVFIGDGQTIPYARMVLEGSIYQPFSALPDGVLAGRLKAGVLIAANDQLPFDRKFFAGGGGSVRGYGYQSIGPRDANGNPLGGQSVIEGSVEARWKLRGPFGIAVFADAARVGSLDDVSEQQTKIGVGVGLRYNLGLAPLRIDLAVPLNKRDGDAPVQIYLSAGQSF